MKREEILEILKKVQDPELKRDLVSLGMVKEITGDDAAGFFIHLEVTTPNSELREALKQAVAAAVSAAAPQVKLRIQISTPSRQPGAAAAPARPVVPGIRYAVAVASGKGGVGKTTVAVNLALALAAKGNRVGLMDGDIYGPNVPLMLGVAPETRPLVNEQEKLLPIEVQGLKMISMGVLVPADQPMIWRGPMLHSAVTQFVQKVDWGELDFLVIDLPPGTGDVQLSLVQVVPLSGAVIVTTPQEVALMDVRKGVAMFRKTQVPILGVIENMSGDVFGRGGGCEAAKQFGVPFLGEVPLDKRVREGGDAGRPMILAQPDSEPARAYKRAAEMIEQIFSQAAQADSSAS